VAFQGEFMEKFYHPAHVTFNVDESRVSLNDAKKAGRRFGSKVNRVAYHRQSSQHPRTQPPSPDRVASDRLSFHSVHRPLPVPAFLWRLIWWRAGPPSVGVIRGSTTAGRPWQARLFCCKLQHGIEDIDDGSLSIIAIAPGNLLQWLVTANKRFEKE